MSDTFVKVSNLSVYVDLQAELKVLVSQEAFLSTSEFNQVVIGSAGADGKHYSLGSDELLRLFLQKYFSKRISELRHRLLSLEVTDAEG